MSLYTTYTLKDKNNQKIATIEDYSPQFWFAEERYRAREEFVSQAGRILLELKRILTNQAPEHATVLQVSNGKSLDVREIARIELNGETVERDEFITCIESYIAAQNLILDTEEDRIDHEEDTFDSEEWVIRQEIEAAEAAITFFTMSPPSAGLQQTSLPRAKPPAPGS